MKKLSLFTLLFPLLLFSEEAASNQLNNQKEPHTLLAFAPDDTGGKEDPGSIIQDKSDEKIYQDPWLTGPILCPSAHTIPGGHYNLEPYLYVNDNIGFLNNHWHLQRYAEPRSNINMQFVTQMGINSWWDFQFTPQFFYNYYETQDTWRFGDLVMATGFQLLNQNDREGIPALKFQIGEVFPTGMYQNLFADKLSTDASGGGSFVTKLSLIVSRLWHFSGVHFLSGRFHVGVGLPSKVRVNGINSYGGDPTTVGTVKPGKSFNSVLGLEYTLTQNWALALDVAAGLTGKTSFSGTTVSPVGNNQLNFQLSLAPAFEYNASEKVGLIAGVWFTALGVNSNDFINAVIALNWYI